MKKILLLILFGLSIIGLLLILYLKNIEIRSRSQPLSIIRPTTFSRKTIISPSYGPKEDVVPSIPLNWISYKNENLGIIFSYPFNVEPPHQRITHSNDSITKPIIEFNTQCSGLSILELQSNKSLDDYIRYDFFKLKSNEEWSHYKNNYLQLVNNKIQIGEKETINVGPMGIGEISNYFVKNQDSSILLITTSAATPEGMNPHEWTRHPCNLNSTKDSMLIDQILSSIRFTKKDLVFPLHPTNDWNTFTDSQREYTFRYPETYRYIALESGVLAFFDNEKLYQECRSEIQRQIQIIDSYCSKNIFSVNGFRPMTEQQYKSYIYERQKNQGTIQSLFKDTQGRNWDTKTIWVSYYNYEAVTKTGLTYYLVSLQYKPTDTYDPAVEIYLQQILSTFQFTR